MNIFKERSSAFPVSQHFFSWGKYATVVSNAAIVPIAVVSIVSHDSIFVGPID